MAYQFIHPHGPQHQNDLKRCGRDCTYCMAPQSVWNFHQFDERTRLEKSQL